MNTIKTTALETKCWEATKKAWGSGFRYTARKDGKITVSYNGKFFKIISEEEL